MPVTTPRASAGFVEFIAGLEAACRAGAPAAQQAAATESVLKRSLRAEGWLPSHLTRTGSSAYCRRIAHVADDGRFTLMVMTWQPGQSTPIHDHIAWCAVAVYCGEEESVSFALHDEQPAPVLVERKRVRLHRGDTETLIPPAENIHRVTCTGNAAAISLHVYGTDIRVTGSSINHTFDHLEVREGSSGSTLSWR